MSLTPLSQPSATPFAAKSSSFGLCVLSFLTTRSYGKLFRGIKAMIAQEMGAAAVLIYSDPADDGEHRGKTYAEGPWRPERSGQIYLIRILTRPVQRGSVQVPPSPFCKLTRPVLVPLSR